MRALCGLCAGSGTQGHTPRALEMDDGDAMTDTWPLAVQVDVLGDGVTCLCAASGEVKLGSPAARVVMRAVAMRKESNVIEGVAG